MSSDLVEKLVRDAFSAPVRVVQQGRAEYFVETPITFDDGDCLVVAIRLLDRQAGRWLLTDRGHTLLHLALAGVDPTAGQRGDLLEGVLARYGLSNDGGELVSEASSEDELPLAIYDFVQGLVRVSDIGLLKRETVRSLFNEEFKKFAEDLGGTAGWRVELGYIDPVADPDGIYRIDARLSTNGTRVFAFGIANDDKCRDVTISLLHFEKHDVRFHAAAVFEDQTKIGRRVLARFTDVCDRQFASLAAARERMPRYMADLSGRG